MQILLYLLPLLVYANCVWSLPSPAKENVQLSTIAGEASQLIAMHQLKHNKDIDANQVYSPLGLATILAVLSEAAEGETYEEFGKVFGFPNERHVLRAAFEHVLSNNQSRGGELLPSTQTYFYVYRNYTVHEDYRQLLKRHYHVLVKDIYSKPDTVMQLDGSAIDSEYTEPNNSKDVIGFETLKRINLDDDADIGPSDNYGEEVLNKETSKFDREVDDNQYVEKPVALAEVEQLERKRDQEQLTTEQPATEVPSSSDNLVEKLEKPAEFDLMVEENVAAKQQSKRSDTKENPNMEENETVQKDEKIRKLLREPSSASEPKKVRLPLQKLENAVKAMVKEGADEIMMALESHLGEVARAYGIRTLFGQDDIASALTTNTITGRAIGSATKIILINGLYYRGSWAQPFYQLRDGSDEFFFMTNEDAVQTSMMHARGKFHVADLPHLKARLLHLPYENAKYGLCIVLPNDPEGLSEVISQLQLTDFKFARKHSHLKELHVTLPKFQVEETTYSRAMLQQLGLKRLFSRTGVQLVNLSDDQDVHVDDIAQFVNVRVDEGGSRARAWSAPKIRTRSIGAAEAATTLPIPEPEPEPGVEQFDVNRPFAFFVMDCEQQFVLASGKVYQPDSTEIEGTRLNE